jgi:hypothetical protein
MHSARHGRLLPNPFPFSVQNPLLSHSCLNSIWNLYSDVKKLTNLSPELTNRPTSLFILAETDNGSETVTGDVGLSAVMLDSHAGIVHHTIRRAGLYGFLSAGIVATSATHTAEGRD